MTDTPAPDASWFVEMAHGSRTVFFILRVQPDIAYEYISDAVYEEMGITAEEILADPEALHGQLSEDSVATFAAALGTAPGTDIWLELKWFHRNGDPVHSRCWARIRQRPDNSVILEGTVSAITELREIQTELQHSEERYRLLAENAWEVIWTMAMDGTVTYVSPAVQRMRGITPEEAKNQTLEEINTPESAARVTDYYQRVFAAIEAGTEPPVFRGEMDYYRKDGSIMTGELQVIPHIDSGGQVVELLGVTRDISERKMFEAELTRLADTDPVTGVWNRHHGRRLLEAETATSAAGSAPLSVLMVDIDDFKSINDRFGHQAGDEVLVEVAQRLRDSVRRTDAVARWGGEEFVILLHDCALDDAVARAEKIRRQISDTEFAGVGTVTTSMGAAQLSHPEDVASLLSRADTALYQAKRSGRNRVVAARRG